MNLIYEAMPFVEKLLKIIKHMTKFFMMLYVIMKIFFNNILLFVINDTPIITCMYGKHMEK